MKNRAMKGPHTLLSVLLLSIGIGMTCSVPVLALSVEVDYVVGDVRYRHLKEDWQNLDVGMTLLSGDMIETGTSSEAILLDGEGEIVGRSRPTTIRFPHTAA